MKKKLIFFAIMGETHYFWHLNNNHYQNLITFSIPIMNIKYQISALLLAGATVMALNTSAANVNLNEARSTANSYLKVHAAATGSLRAPALADLKLAHAETSSVDRSANVYYAFNIDGGGFIIVAGEDRASQVLGYCDRGKLDFNNLPDNFKALMDDFQTRLYKKYDALEVMISQMNAQYNTIFGGQE